MSNLHLTALVLHSSDPSLCEYLFHGNAQDPYVAITFGANPGLSAAAYGAGLKQAQSNVKAVPGLGDAAFSFGAPGSGAGDGLSFLSGHTICTILTTVPAPASGAIALAKAIIGA